MKVLFIGMNADFSYIPLKAVAAAHEVVGVVCTSRFYYVPEAEEQHRIWDGPMKVYRYFKPLFTLQSFARERGVPCFLLDRSNRDALPAFVRDCGADIICSSAAPMLKREVFAAPLYGAINFHPSLLPKYRGPSPWIWQYYFMEAETGATIHFIDDGEDTGDILKQESLPIELGMPVGVLIRRTALLGGRLMAEALDEIEAGQAEIFVQRDMPCPFRARNVEPDEKLIDWENWPIERVWHVLQGTWPWLEHIPERTRGMRWQVGDYRLGAVAGEPGSFVREGKTAYFCHPMGRIYVKPVWSWKQWLKEGLYKSSFIW